MLVSVGTSTRFKLVPLWSFLFCSVNSVSCQVQGFVGGSVLLPCLYKGSDLPQEVTVFWRDKDDSRVLDITRNKPDLSAQSSKFRNRVQTFLEQYKKGNFSIVLTSLQRSDSGPYTCDILQVDIEQRVMLSVSDVPAIESNSCRANDQQQHSCSMWQSELVTYSSFALNLLLTLTTAALVGALLCLKKKKKKNCNHEVDDPSPVIYENIPGKGALPSTWLKVVYHSCDRAGEELQPQPPTGVMGAY